MTSSETLGSPVQDALARRGRECDAHLEMLLHSLQAVPSRLGEAISYSLFAGGKRIRPALVLEWHAAVARATQPNRSALCAAAAIELIHTFSLIHDDLPAMDNDDLRRGKPTNHRVFGEALAILAGDAMTTLAFEQLSCAEDRHIGLMMRELAVAAGPQGMVGGQVMDLESEHVALSMEALRKLHAMKTGALLACACRLGAIAADAAPAQLEVAGDYGRCVGLAFQIMDDVLDETSTPQQMGKATKKDGHAGKNTYPRLLGVEQSLALAQAEVDRAVAGVASLGEAGTTLAALARFVIDRKS